MGITDGNSSSCFCSIRCGIKFLEIGVIKMKITDEKDLIVHLEIEKHIDTDIRNVILQA